MKSLAESLITKKNIKNVSFSKNRDIIIFVPNPDDSDLTFILSNKELLNINVKSLDQINTFLIVGRPMLRKVLSIVDNADDRDYWYIPKGDYNIKDLDKLEELIENLEFYSDEWDEDFEEIEFPKL